MSLDRDQVVAYLDSLDKETKAIKSEALKLCWYMRGGLSLEESMTLSQTDKELISNIIKENLETTKESGLPFF